MNDDVTFVAAGSRHQALSPLRQVTIELYAKVRAYEAAIGEPAWGQGEVSMAGFLNVAAWSSGLVGIQEFLNIKKWKVDRRYNATGRGDLYIATATRGFGIELKVAAATPRSCRQALGRVEAAATDASCLDPRYQDHVVGCTVVTWNGAPDTPGTVLQAFTDAVVERGAPAVLIAHQTFTGRDDDTFALSVVWELITR